MTAFLFIDPCNDEFIVNMYLSDYIYVSCIIFSNNSIISMKIYSIYSIKLLLIKEKNIIVKTEAFPF